MMRFDLRTPCRDCPFRTDRPFLGLSMERKADIAYQQKIFACHKTTPETAEVDSVAPQACAGFLITNFLELQSGLKTEQPAFTPMFFAAFLGFFKPQELDMSAPVFRSRAEFIAGKENKDD